MYSLTEGVISVWSLMYPPIESVIPVMESTCVVGEMCNLDIHCFTVLYSLKFLKIVVVNALHMDDPHMDQHLSPKEFYRSN